MRGCPDPDRDALLTTPPNKPLQPTAPGVLQSGTLLARLLRTLAALGRGRQLSGMSVRPRKTP